MDTDAALEEDSRHSSSAPDTLWTTVNVSEALPGVATPLGWSVWGPALDQGVRKTFAEFGVLTPHESAGPHSDHDRIVSIFYGRPALRADFMLTIGERMPGTSGEAVATALFDAVPPGYVGASERKYYLRAATRIPRMMLSSPRRIRQIRADTEAWWRTEIPRLATADTDTARAVFGAAVERFNRIMFLHTCVTFSVVQPAYDQLSALVTKAGLGTALLSGGGDHEETALVRDMWVCSRGQLELSTLLERHGYHGPNEGDIAGRVWREDPAPLIRMLDGYRALGPEADPTVREREFAAERARDLQTLLTSLSGPSRVKARAVLRFAGRCVALRGVGKVAFLQSLDIARAAARRLGTTLHTNGVLADPEDIFFLTAAEITAADWDGARARIERRKQAHATYSELELPVQWRGEPDPTPVARVTEQVEFLDGLGASPGVVEGLVRVVLDPSDIELQPDEILVTQTTDPSWAAIMFLSAGLVTDIGGMLSHAAIVARELGVPCVANTHVGTRVLHTGDRIRVDGTTGRIDVLQRVSS